jgi:hypothetical protein
LAYCHPLAGKKLQRAGAVQDASRCLVILVPRVASWTAVALYRFPLAKPIAPFN